MAKEPILYRAKDNKWLGIAFDIYAWRIKLGEVPNRREYSETIHELEDKQRNTFNALNGDTITDVHLNELITNLRLYPELALNTEIWDAAHYNHLENDRLIDQLTESQKIAEDIYRDLQHSQIQETPKKKAPLGCSPMVALGGALTLGLLLSPLCQREKRPESKENIPTPAEVINVEEVVSPALTIRPRQQ